MIDRKEENARYKASLECAIISAFGERGFDFTKEEWQNFETAGYDKESVARLCCNHVVFSSVDCLDRYILVAYDNGPEESAVKNVLEERYDQWNDIDNYPEVETYCCEEWMIKGITDFADFKFHVIYGDYDE